MIVVTGKGYGATNFIAMDRSGEVLVDRVIQVEGPTDQLVTVYRGVDRESYSCMPICQRRVTLGDGDDLLQVGDGSGRHSQQPGRRRRGVAKPTRTRCQRGRRDDVRRRCRDCRPARGALRKMVNTGLTKRVVLLRSGETLQQSVSGNPLRAVDRCRRLGVSRCRRPLFQPPHARSVLRRFRRNRRGSAAVEFALVAPVFFALLFAIIETAIVFFASQVLETVTQNSARQIMTGQAQDANYAQANSFKDRIVCSSGPGAVQLRQHLRRCAKLLRPSRTWSSRT